MLPECPRALGLVVMHDQEVANALVFEGDLPVVPIDVGLPEGAVGKVIEQQGDAAVDQMDAGGFERLEEAGGEPDGNAVLAPAHPSSSGRESQPQRIAQRAALQIGHQRLLGLIVAEEGTGVHVAIADPMLQRNAPLPAHVPGGREGVRGERPGALAGDGDGAITGQPVRPILVTGLQCALDQQAPKTGAVEVQIGLDALAAFEYQASDESVLRAKLDALELAFRAGDATRLRIATQVGGQQRRIQMQRISDGRERGLLHSNRAHEAGLACGDRLQRVILEGGGGAALAALEPVRREFHILARQTGRTEGVDVGVPRSGPVLEFDA